MYSVTFHHSLLYHYTPRWITTKVTFIFLWTWWSKCKNVCFLVAGNKYSSKGFSTTLPTSWCFGSAFISSCRQMCCCLMPRSDSTVSVVQCNLIRLCFQFQAWQFSFSSHETKNLQHGFRLFTGLLHEEVLNTELCKENRIQKGHLTSDETLALLQGDSWPAVSRRFR